MATLIDPSSAMGPKGVEKVGLDFRIERKKAPGMSRGFAVLMSCLPAA